MITIDQLQQVTGDLTDDGELKAYRESNWAGHSERGVEVFGYDQGMQVLEHPALLKGPSFQYRLDQLGIQGEARRYMDLGITNKEGEERRQMRASLGALFRPAQIAKLREAIRKVANDILDEIEDPTEFDLMRLCWEIPARTYCELVSIPHSESGTVIRIADSVLGTLLNVDRSRREEAEEAILESVDIVRRHLDARRGQLGDDFTSVMLRQQLDGLMTEEQLVAQSFALLQASVDNTAHQMGNTLGMLLSEPERWEAFLSDRTLSGVIIEESIRLYPRFGTIFRLADEDVVIDNLTIPKGTWTFVSVRAAQRDPSAFDAPDEYRLDRSLKRPVMFGAGPYNCLGQNLARMEIEEALNAIATRYPRLVLRGGWKRNLANAVSETSSLIVDLGTPEARQTKSAEPETLPHAEPTHAPIALGVGESIIDCEIASLNKVATDVLAIELRAHDGSELPAWQPGAHIDLVLPNGLVRQYSLCGDMGDRKLYRIAVLREEDGLGGSDFVHTRLAAGDRLEIRGPRNNFRLQDAQGYVFVAGGIGITAILPMAREAHVRGQEWSLVYLGRSPERLAFLDELQALPSERVNVVATGTSGRPAISNLIGPERTGTMVYACGPAGLLQSIGAMGWNDESIHFERFEPDAAALAAPKTSFKLRLSRSDRSLDVPSEKSILDVLEESGVSWPYSCREGTCGSCEARIVAGRADHRDAVLTPSERRLNEYMMVCVSRCASEELELDI